MREKTVCRCHQRLTLKRKDFPHPTSLRSATCLACRLGRRFCLRQRCPPDTRGLACRLGQRFCLRQRCPPDTRGLACRLGRRFCLRQRCPPDTRGLACRLGRRFCLRQRCPPDTRAPREGVCVGRSPTNSALAFPVPRRAWLCVLRTAGVDMSYPRRANVGIGPYESGIVSPFFLRV